MVSTLAILQYGCDNVAMIMDRLKMILIIPVVVALMIIAGMMEME